MDKIVFNHDYPYNDFAHFDETSTKLSYIVGENNIGQGKDQKKYFVSKSTLIYCTEETHVHFNNVNNVAITILANTLFTFWCDIKAIYVTAISQDKDLYIWTEGVLPQEVRDAE